MGNNTLEVDGFVFIKHLIPEDVAHFLSYYTCKEASENRLKRGIGSPSAEHTNTLNMTGNAIMPWIMHSVLRSKIENIVGKDLIPTYPYIRTYLKGADMLEHKDRPECQYSVTVNLGQSDPYPLFIDGWRLHMEPGDGVVYKGCEMRHYREKFTGYWYTQMFIHYIDDTSNAKPWDGNITPKEIVKMVNEKWKEIL